MYLVDTSAWFAARRTPSLGGWFGTILAEARVATIDAVNLELLHSSRNIADFQQRRLDLARLPTIDVDGPIWRRATDIYEALAAKGGSHHRQVPHPDLLVAAAAEQAGLPVLHYDSDFDVIASVTGQPVEWIAPRGSL